MISTDVYPEMLISVADDRIRDLESRRIAKQTRQARRAARFAKLQQRLTRPAA